MTTNEKIEKLAAELAIIGDDNADWIAVARHVLAAEIEARIDALHTMIPPVNKFWTNPNGLELAKEWQQRGYEFIKELKQQLLELKK